MVLGDSCDLALGHSEASVVKTSVPSKSYVDVEDTVDPALVHWEAWAAMKKTQPTASPASVVTVLQKALSMFGRATLSYVYKPRVLKKHRVLQRRRERL